MEKPTVFSASDYAALRARVESLTPESPRQWGRMDAAQMLAHINVPLEAGLGKIQLVPEGNALTRALLKVYVLRQKSFKPGLPTARQFKVGDVRDFDTEKRRLLENLDEAHRRGLRGPWHPHNLFGRLKEEQWGTLLWVHVDHHLRQFGV